MRYAHAITRSSARALVGRSGGEAPTVLISKKGGELMKLRVIKLPKFLSAIVKKIIGLKRR